MVEFGPNQEVTPLPCSVKHYFHTECITEWIKTKPECPICRATLSEDKLATFATKVEVLLKEEAEHE